jgi:hypothetical protein
VPAGRPAVPAISPAQQGFGNDAPNPFAEIVKNIVDNSGDGATKPPATPSIGSNPELPQAPPTAPPIAVKPPAPKPGTITQPEPHEKPAAPTTKQPVLTDEKLTREHGPRPHAAKPVQPAGNTETPALVAPVTIAPTPAAIPHSLWAAFTSDTGEGSSESPHSAVAKPDNPKPTEKQTLLPQAALEIRLRSADKEPINPEPGTPATVDDKQLPVDLPRKPHQGANEQPLPLRLSHTNATEGATTPITPPPTHASNEVPPFTLQDAAKRPEPQVSTAPERRPAASATAPPPDVLPERAETTQPLRTVSLEFTPDGASDVRLRLSERSGEVHISLHSSDASLSGRLHEGIHDLVGSLSTAGYYAEAWTPNQDRQQNQQPEDSPKRRRTGSSSSAAEQFSGILQQPVQEVL